MTTRNSIRELPRPTSFTQENLKNAATKNTALCRIKAAATKESCCVTWRKWPQSIMNSSKLPQCSYSSYQFPSNQDSRYSRTFITTLPRLKRLSPGHLEKNKIKKKTNILFHLKTAPEHEVLLCVRIEREEFRDVVEEGEEDSRRAHLKREKFL